jgi:hypothetical protein
MEWDARTLARMSAQAQKGDVNSAHQLSIYYEINHNQKESRKWEDWLIKKGDKDTIEYRAEIDNLQARRIAK